MVVKLPVLLEGTRQISLAYRLYEREVSCYQHLADRSPFTTPELYYGAHDIASDDFVLVMEDVGHLRAPDQVAGCDPDDARSAVAALARHHAAFWDDAAVVGDTYPWLPFASDPPIPQMVIQGVTALWEPFVQFMGDRLDPRILPLGSWLPAHVEELLAVPAGRPYTVVHGDYRLDNMFFDAQRNVTLLDWQLVGKASGAFDVAYFISQSLPVDTRRALQDELFAIYLSELASYGVTYDEDDFWSDLQRAALFGLFYVVQVMAADITDPRTVALIHEGAMRSVTTIIDTGAIELIR